MMGVWAKAITGVKSIRNINEGRQQWLMDKTFTIQISI